MLPPIPPVVDARALPPEERDFITQLGKISRPFAHDPRDPLWRRTVALAYRLLAAPTWEVVGVDTSYWNTIDWSILSQYVSFVIIRYGYGNDWVDPKAEMTVQACLDYHIAYDGYWYLTMKNHRMTAESFFNARRRFGGQMYPDFDLEETGGLGKTLLASWVVKCVSRYCELSGVEFDNTLLYTSPGFYNRYVEPGFLKRMKLHVANWTTFPTPLLPVDWKTWKLWQWKVGPLPGVKIIDQNRYNGTKADFAREFDLTPPPGEEDMIARVIGTPFINVRPGPGTNYPDQGDLPTGTTFAVKNVLKGETPSCSIWFQIKAGEFENKWACLYDGGKYLCEIVMQ